MWTGYKIGNDYDSPNQCQGKLCTIREYGNFEMKQQKKSLYRKSKTMMLEKMDRTEKLTSRHVFKASYI